MESRWVYSLARLIITLACSGAMLIGCGQKGDLYLPDKPESQDQQPK